MKNKHQPIRTTIIFGLICGLLFIPMSMGLSYLLYWPKAFCTSIWLFLAVYSFLLARWGKINTATIIFPLIVLLIFVYIVDSPVPFIVLALGILSWIRSSICFKKTLVKMLTAETIICFGGGALVAFFIPHSTFSWALGICMFFLVQALYFVLFENVYENDEEKFEVDPFEQAMMRAGKIMSNNIIRKT